MSDMSTPHGIISSTYVSAWDHSIMKDGADAIMAALDAAGYKIVRKDVTDEMLERLRGRSEQIGGNDG